MTPPLSRLAAVFLLAVALFGLGGCFSSTPATRLYLLTPMTDATADANNKVPATAAPVVKPVSLVIREVRVPQYLDRPQIVTRGSGQRLLISEYDQWGGNLREDLTRILSENLGRVLGSDRVVAAPYSMAWQPDYRIDVEVLRFERDAEGQVRLSARWRLMAGRDAVLLASPEAAFSVAPADSSYSSLVAAMSSAYADLARAIADSIRKVQGS